MRNEKGQFIKGNKHSKEWYKSVSGRTPWNKGKTGFMKHTKEWKQRMSEKMKGHENWMPKDYVAWNKGLKLPPSWNAGKHLTKQHKLKLRITKLGKSLTKEHKIKIGLANKGKHHSEETKRKISEWHKGKKLSENHKQKLRIKRPSIQGNKNYRWIDDRTLLKIDRKKSYDTKYKYWMLKVKERDNWKCRINNQDCNGRLESHHILNWRDYPELRYNINNGITLCRFHHPRKRVDEKRLIPMFQTLVEVIRT